jgi:hypothetical protein
LFNIKLNLFGYALLQGIFLVPAAFADVLRDHDNGPLTGIFGIPDSTEGAQLLQKGERAWDLSITHASHSMDDPRPTESLYLDGETARADLRFRFGIGARMEVGVELPYVRHQAGHLDSFIDSWHSLLGLPTGHRPARDNDVLDFRYSDTTGTTINVSSSSSGIGDVRLFGGWQLFSRERHQLALRFGAKFPTGDSSALHGSGGTDLSLGLAGDVVNLFGINKLSGFYRMHAIHIGEPDLLSNRYQEWASFFSTGVGLQITDRIELRLQGASRSALYESDLRSLGGSATTVTFGGNIRIFDKYELSLGVSEDADAETAPDVAFQISLRYREIGG